MILHAAIALHDEILLAVSVQTSYDVTGIEAGNHLRRAILSASHAEIRDPVFDQFLLATAASDWAFRAVRGRRDAVATVPCSMGRPCDTQDVPVEHARHLDPEEPVMHLWACAEADNDRPMTTRSLTVVRKQDQA